MVVPTGTVLGWPKVDDAYWTEANIKGVAKRYVGVDMAEYETHAATRTAATSKL